MVYSFSESPYTELHLHQSPVQSEGHQQGLQQRNVKQVAVLLINCFFVTYSMPKINENLKPQQPYVQGSIQRRQQL